MTATSTGENAKPRKPRINGISADAKALGVTREHLFLVLRGKRGSDPLRARYQALKESQQEARMQKAKRPSAANKVPMPIALAALQNLHPVFFKTLTTLGLDVLIVRFESAKGSPIWAHEKIAEDLGRELQAIEVGQHDSSFFPECSQWHFFHVDHARLGAAVRRLKNAIDARGLLGIAGIYHAESAEVLTEWFPGTAKGISVPIDFE